MSSIHSLNSALAVGAGRLFVEERGLPPVFFRAARPPRPPFSPILRDTLKHALSIPLLRNVRDIAKMLPQDGTLQSEHENGVSKHSAFSQRNA